MNEPIVVTKELRTTYGETCALDGPDLQVTKAKCWGYWTIGPEGGPQP